MERQRTKFSIVTSAEQTDDDDDDHHVISTDRSRNDDDTQLKTMSDFIIVYLCVSNDNRLEETNELLKQLRYILNTAKQFTDVNECLDFLTDLVETKVFLVTNNYPKEYLLSILRELDQIYSIYVFASREEKDKSSFTDVKLVKTTYDNIEHMCNVIKRDINSFIKNSTPFSIIYPSDSLSFGELDQSFMYTQLLKEIIMDIQYDKTKERDEFVQFCLSSTTLDIPSPGLMRFQRSYENHSPLWWYSKEGFIYSLVNRGLRMLDINIILKMGFFLQDLHREIEHKHSEQKSTAKINVYRGQGLSTTEFEKLKNSTGGLFSFNSFLSTSLDYDTSRAFAESNCDNHDMIGVLFKMKIDPTFSSTPFISLEDVTAFKDEDEILFSMHTVFRIGDMNQIHERLWEICLVLTADNDTQLKNITDFIRNEISAENPWDRLALLMRTLGKSDKMYEIFFAMAKGDLINDPDKSEGRSFLLQSSLNLILYQNGEYSTALSNYKRLLETTEALSPHEHLVLLSIHSDIGIISAALGHFSDAISHCHKALEHYQQIYSPNEAILFTIYNNLGYVYTKIGKYPVALSYFEKTLKVQQNSKPKDHPDIAMSLGNIGTVQIYMSEYSIARSNIEKALEIHLKYLPSEHPNTSLYYNNIGITYIQMKDYPNALSYLQKALQIPQKYLPSNHPLLCQIYLNISIVHYSIHDYTNALLYAKLALENGLETLPSDHPDLIHIRSLMGEIYRSMGEYSNALFHHEYALEMSEKLLLPNGLKIAFIYINTGRTHQSLGNYTVALSYYEKALEIQQKFLPPHHSDLANTHKLILSANMSSLNLSSMNLSFAKMVENQQKQFLSDQSIQTDISSGKKDILRNCSELCPELNELVKDHLNSCSDSKADVDSATGIEKWTETVNVTFSNMLKTLKHEQESSRIKSEDETKINEAVIEALSCFKDLANTDQQDNYERLCLGVHYCLKVFEIQQKSLPPNDVTLSVYYNYFGEMYCEMEIYSEALLLFEKALDILQKCHLVNQQLLAKTHDNMSLALGSLHRYTEAIGHVQQAFEIACSTFGSDHPETEIYRTHFQQLGQRL